jgi:TetR/AcrR family transcriptional regulator, transcriptional repressor for nem operon
MARNKSFDTEETIAQAMQIFWLKGYQATSVEDLVNFLGINRQSMYDTFGDKHQLFKLALQKYRSNYGQMTIQTILGEGDIRTKLFNLLNGVIETAQQDPAQKGCMMVNVATELAPQDAEIAQIVAENRQKIENAIAQALLEAQEKGEISNKHSAQALAAFFFNTFSGMQVLARSNAPKNTMTEIMEVALSVLD